jgi:flagellin-like hook-associated protein FlgL
MPTTQIVSNELELRVVGSAASISVAFDKSSYIPGEEATLTLTAKDVNGFVVPSQTIADLLAAGVDYSSGTDLTDTTVALTKGVKTFKVNVPTVSGNFIASVKGGTGLPLAARVTVSDTVSVVNPAEDAANEALDAAIAATDAAILAEEAAANAEAAATAAAETAEAALDAVTALSAQVTKLVAQLASLQKLINKIAKRVGVKQ